jgi:endonuclease YncB( thermonuclease family)
MVLAAWWYGVRPIMEERGWNRVTQSFALCGERGNKAHGCVVDGDSLLIGFGKDRRRIRLTGFDAPELAGACEEERRMALRARDALHE